MIKSINRDSKKIEVIESPNTRNLHLPDCRYANNVVSRSYKNSPRITISIEELKTRKKCRYCLGKIF